MSTVVAKNVQVGTSGTATNNFTIFQPATPDGTVRIANGNSGTTTDLVTLTSAGNLGIGTSSPGTKLHVVGGSIRADDTNIMFLNPNYGPGAMALQGFSNVPLVFCTNNTERMRIDSSGNLLVGTTSNGTGANISSSRGLGTTNAATGRFATVEYGSGASGTFSTITISFTVDSSNSSVILETLMTGFSGVFMDRVDARYSSQAAVVMRNNSSGASGSFSVNGAVTTYTLTISTSVTHPVVKVKATVGGLGTTITLPTITFA